MDRLYYWYRSIFSNFTINNIYICVLGHHAGLRGSIGGARIVGGMQDGGGHVRKGGVRACGTNGPNKTKMKQANGLYAQA